MSYQNLLQTFVLAALLATTSSLVTVTSDSLNNKLGISCLESPCDTRNAHCNSSNICDCQSEFVRAGENCLKPLKLGDVCLPDTACAVAFAQCDVNDKCNCNIGYFLSLDQNKCLKKVALGDACSEDITCSTIPNALCYRGYCACAPGYLADASRENCEVDTKDNIGDFCSIQEQCMQGKPGPESDCIAGTCLCKPSAVMHPAPGSGDYICLKKPNYIGDDCMMDFQCSYISGSICIATRCECAHGYTASSDGTACVLHVKDSIGDVCYINEQCTEGQLGFESECKDASPTNTGTCECNSVAVEDPAPGRGEKICLRKATVIGDVCKIDAQCADLSNSLCDFGNMRCSCVTGYYEEAGTCQKLQDAELGNPCFDDSDCVDPNSECGFSPGCTEKVCQCKFPFFHYGHKCYSIIGDLGAVCEIDAQCAIPYSLCRIINDGNATRVCACHDDFFQEINKCIPKIEIGDSCQKEEECRDPWATCDDNICTCRPEFYFDYMFGECVPKKQFGDPCYDDRECQMPGQYLTCDGMTCVCREEALEYDYRCYEKVEVIGNHCDVSPQCVYDHGICVDNKCACDIGYSAQNNICIPSPVLGGNCTSNQHCTVFGSECSSKGVCECKSDFVTNKELQTCHEIRYVVNDPCDIDEQCTAGSLGQHSFCKNDSSDGVQACHCRDLAVYDPTAIKHVCYPKQLELDAPCAINQQCSTNLGRYAQCDVNSHSCTCVAHAVSDPENTFCYPIVDYSGSPCEIKRQCINGNLGSLSDCLESSDDGNKYCECKFNAVNDPSLTPSRCFEKRHYLNETCDIDQQCSVNIGPLSHCSQDKICECQKNSGKPSQDGTKCIPA